MGKNKVPAREIVIWSFAGILLFADICVFINMFIRPLPDLLVIVSGFLSLLSFPAIFIIGLRISKKRGKK